MTSVLLSPHHDDETLFAAYTILRHDPRVITVMGRAEIQTKHGITGAQRSRETMRALWWLGDPRWDEWPISDADPDPDAILRRMNELDVDLCPDLVFAPLWEDGGHEQHNLVNKLALRVFGDRLECYATYVRGHTRTVTDNEHVPEPGWPSKKFRAMACYESQIELAITRPWFNGWDREWLA